MPRMVLQTLRTHQHSRPPLSLEALVEDPLLDKQHFLPPTMAPLCLIMLLVLLLHMAPLHLIIVVVLLIYLALLWQHQHCPPLSLEVWEEDLPLVKHHGVALPVPS